ncbi:MAG TPA: hypothetical protein PKW37_06290, partial [Salinivirgaceae bacterium]|nr:hypothetical protein [Salinivirgaceae bacterium]
MPLITNINEAKAELTRLIQARGGSIEKTEDLTLRKRYGNFRFFTKEGEVFHLKYGRAWLKRLYAQGKLNTD